MATPTKAILDLQSARWRQAKVLDTWRSRSVGIIEKTLDKRPVYEDVAAATGVPWWAVAVFHNMEMSQRFDKHLHNGDPLSARTVRVPSGRPKTGSPPFTWRESAIDAIKNEKNIKFTKVNWGDVAESLQALEAYNGLGYQKYHPSVPSPYLWSGTTLARPGKYVEDPKPRFDPKLESKQLGAVAFLKLLMEKGVKVW